MQEAIRKDWGDHIGAGELQTFIDYVEIMLKNRKPRAEVEESLQAFLGSSTSEFCDWLFRGLETEFGAGRPMAVGRSTSLQTGLRTATIRKQSGLPPPTPMPTPSSSPTPPNRRISSVVVVPGAGRTRSTGANWPQPNSRLLKQAMSDVRPNAQDVEMSSTSDKDVRPRLTSTRGNRSILSRISDAPRTSVPESELSPSLAQRLGPPVHRKVSPQKRSRMEIEDDDQNMDFEEAGEAMDEGHESGGTKKVKVVRCKHWPECKKDDCPFHHPSEVCRSFPQCRFGDQCLNIHPSVLCKYGAHCTQKNCNYSHTQIAVPRYAPSFKPKALFPAKVCRFGAACTKPGCAFSHVRSPAATPCKYFPNCVKPNCPYRHNMVTGSMSMRFNNIATEPAEIVIPAEVESKESNETSEMNDIAM